MGGLGSDDSEKPQLPQACRKLDADLVCSRGRSPRQLSGLGEKGEAVRRFSDTLSTPPWASHSRLWLQGGC